MRPSDPALKALLDGWTPRSHIQRADLYTFSLKGGEVLRYSGFQTGLIAPPPPDAVTGAIGAPELFVLGPGFGGVKTKERIGTQVDELEIEIYAGPNDTLGLNAGTPTWQYAVWAGLFDGADVTIDRAYITPQAGVVGSINRFTGRVGDVENGRTRIIMHVKSLLDLLTQQMPRRLYQAACTHVFGDAMCQFDRTTMAVTVTAATADQNQVAAGFSPSPATLYDNGTIKGLTGANAGYTRTIGKLAGGTAGFLKPWIFPVAAGDQFTLLPGCDHTVATCDGTFANIIHYGGFPFIPPPETAV